MEPFRQNIHILRQRGDSMVYTISEVEARKRSLGKAERDTLSIAHNIAKQELLAYGRNVTNQNPARWVAAREQNPFSGRGLVWLYTFNAKTYALDFLFEPPETFTLVDFHYIG
jgi:hypothetical protein